MKGKFRVLGVESRKFDEKTFYTVLLRTADGATHKVDCANDSLKSYLDKDVELQFSLKWGKFSAGVQVDGVA